MSKKYDLDAGETVTPREPTGRSDDGKRIKIDKSVNVVSIVQLFFIVVGGIFALGVMSAKLEAGNQTALETKSALGALSDKLDKQVDRLDKRIDSLFGR